MNKKDKMRRKRAFALILLVMGMGFLGCVSPFYGTAKIEPGLHSTMMLFLAQQSICVQQWQEEKTAMQEKLLICLELLPKSPKEKD